MSNRLKRYAGIWLALVMCLSMVACGGSADPDFDVGRDWRVTGIVRASGTITRDGEDTVVLVCVHKKDANFYYDSEDQCLFDWVEYPEELVDKVARSGNVWEMFMNIGFDDLNGDGDSDVTMWFAYGGSVLEAVWYWDAESCQYVFQPEASQLGEDTADASGDVARKLPMALVALLLTWGIVS